MDKEMYERETKAEEKGEKEPPKREEFGKHEKYLGGKKKTHKIGGKRKEARKRE